MTSGRTDRRQARREVFEVFGINTTVHHGVDEITVKLEDKLHQLEQAHNDSHCHMDMECGMNCRICEAQSTLISQIRSLLQELLRSQVSATELSSLPPKHLNFCRSLLTQPSPKTSSTVKPRKLSKPDIQTHELLYIM
ncbi:unnamed protein product [Bursaphelenchus okinawaensis]|uniref:Uncharacterized protein n=1 Tax=Bursaphelenchus okinawaensis TaxID=465554 RepID=A0A811JW79_9BILA|nr:unnamed protein product [Bursaphelenchus okinawaensis]CAG9085184.1 unnamed protein product [Bursaphelenchus okinawaensis]